MKNLTIAFCDFWPSFNERKNFIYNTLKSKYNVTVVDAGEHPDILFYSYFGLSHLRYNDMVKVYFTGESDVPDFNLCDYAISFHDLTFGHRHMRLPLYVLYKSFDELRRGERKIVENPLSRDFCSVVVSNMKNSDSARADFFYKLSDYKAVASGGRFANNVGGRVKDKIAFISDYKFNIAFENSKVEGYTTEKIVEAFAAGTVPIYWGDPLVGNDFNPHSFIDVTKFKSFDDAVKFIETVDKDNGLYLDMLGRNPLKDNPYLDWESQLSDFLSWIVDNMKRYRVDSGAIGTAYRHKVSRERIYDLVTLKRLNMMRFMKRK